MKSDNFVSTQRLRVGLCSIAVLTMLGFVLPPPVLGQGGQASIQGTVADQTGAAVPAAQISITNTATGLTQQTVTSSSGTYVVPLLPVGTYTVKCTKE